MKLSQAKQTIRQFLREHYTDERLAMLLAHAQSGQLNFDCCCCLVGTATLVDGRLLNDWPSQAAGRVGKHIHSVRYADAFGCGTKVSDAYANLSNGYKGFRWFEGNEDAMRRTRLIPMIRAEFRRRDRERQPVCSECRSEQPVNEIQVCLSNK